MHGSSSFSSSTIHYYDYDYDYDYLHARHALQGAEVRGRTLTEHVHVGGRRAREGA